MGIADGVLWPLAAGPDRTRWGAQALELYLHLAPDYVAAWPAAEASSDRPLWTSRFLKSRPEVEAAVVKGFSSPKTGFACVELLARLNGELP